jgi:hypothetical protein
MSRINGDKARFHRVRKQRAALRKRQRETLHTFPIKAPVAPLAKKPIERPA